MVTAPPEILCGGSETSFVALEAHAARLGIDISDISDIDVYDFLNNYEATKENRTTVDKFIGDGIVRFGLFNGETIIGAVHICQAKILNRIDDIVAVGITPLVHRVGVRVFNRTYTSLTQQFLSDQVSLIRYVLNNTFDVYDSPFIVKPVVVDPHPRNITHENSSAVVAYDNAMATAMSAFNEINTVQAFEGARQYNLYKLKTTPLSALRK